MTSRHGHAGRIGAAITAALLGLAAPTRAEMAPGTRGDGIVDLNVGGRDLIVHTDGVTINGFLLTSASAVLSSEPYAGTLGVFVTDGDSLLADQLGYVLDGVHDLGRVVAGDLSFEELCGDLTLTYTIGGQEGIHEATILVAVAGDVDVDGDVDFRDLRAMQPHFGQAGRMWTHGDFDGNGGVDWRDYLTIKGAAAGLPAGGAAMPGPAALPILAAGAAWLLRRRR